MKDDFLVQGPNGTWVLYSECREHPDNPENYVWRDIGPYGPGYYNRNSVQRKLEKLPHFLKALKKASSIRRVADVVGNYEISLCLRDQWEPYWKNYLRTPNHVTLDEARMVGALWMQSLWIEVPELEEYHAQNKETQ